MVIADAAGSGRDSVGSSGAGEFTAGGEAISPFWSRAASGRLAVDVGGSGSVGASTRGAGGRSGVSEAGATG